MKLLGLFNPRDFNYSNDDPNRFVSGFLNQNGVQSPFLTEHVYLDDNDVLHAQPTFNIEENLGEALNLITAYSSIKHIYHEKMRVYKGDHAVLHKHDYDSFLAKRKNNMAVNIPKNMVNTFSGFFNGIPPKINYQPSGSDPNEPLDDKSQAVNDWINNAFNNSHYSDVLFELGKKSDIYGRSYLITYLDNDGSVKFKDISPENCIIVYSNDFDERPLFSIYYTDFSGPIFGTLFTDDHAYDLSSLNETDTTSLTPGENPLGKVPVIEMPENDERMGMFDDAMSAIDKLDKAYSLKFNDVDYFSNAILFLKGFKKLNKDERRAVRRWHVLQSTPDGTDPNLQVDANYLAKPQNDQQQQNFIHDVESEIYQNAQIINLSDPNLGASASGDALGKKLQPMVMLADSKARKMTNAVKQLLSIMLIKCPLVNDNDINDVVANTQIKFTPNIPHSLLDESNIVKNLNGIVSLPTLLSYLSNVNNVNQEINQIDAEKQANQQAIQSMSSNNDDDDSSNNDGDYPDDEDDDSEPSSGSGNE